MGKLEQLALRQSYRQADQLNKRRLRLLGAGMALGIISPLVIYLILLPAHLLFKTILVAPWTRFVLFTPILVVPLIFAYAIVRHKAIPVSFVIRRGRQYLLAKNALRLLLILPIVGLVWNIAANPSRRIDEILLHNSLGFYLCLLAAVSFAVLSRLRLNEWIDRRFFREQYAQEQVLHELTAAVKESDSMAKLARLVSSKIQSALHPLSVYLFLRDDAHDSEFSLGYSTSGNSEASATLKLAADSPLLRFMERQRGAIDFSFRSGSDLPRRERVWLRSIGANLLVPMHGTDGRLAGFFSLGEKLSEIPYTGRP